MDQQGFPWEWVLLVGFSAFVVFGLFLFCWLFPFLFLFSVRRKSHRRTGFWLVIKGRRPLQVMVSFSFFCSFGDNSVLFRYCPVQRPLCIFLLVSLIRSFLLFYFLPFFGWEFSFFSFCFLPLFDWEFPFFSFCFLFDWKFSFFPFLIGNFPSILFLLPRVRIDILTLGQGLW